MTTEAHRQKAEARLIEAGGDAINVIATGMATQETLQNRVKELEAAEHSAGDYPRIAHLARLTDFTINQTNGQDRTEAARLVLRHINPKLRSERLPEELETLAKRAAKYYSDELRSAPKMEEYGVDPKWLDAFDL